MAWYTRGWSFRPGEHAPHSWGRLGAFVDGVYAIAATLLVIELRPPGDAPPGELGAELRHMWPEYVAYAIGFSQMIAGWLQTRRLDAWMRGIDHYATLLVLVSDGSEDDVVESTVDEEFGGANGTLACRLRGYNADGAVLPEPTGLSVCHATRGGIQYRLHARGGKGGMDFGGGSGPSALTTLAAASTALADAARSRGAPIYQFLLQSGEELPWGTSEGTPTDGVLEFWAEILPGTSRDALEAELREIVGRAAGDGTPLEWEQRTRFLAALDGDPEAPIVRAMRAALPGSPGPATAPFACDAFLIAESSPTPVVVCGPGGDNPHAPDEYVNVADLHTLASAYVRLARDWCEEGGAA